MSEQVGSEAYSGVVGCDLLHGSRPSGFRAGQERELESEASEACNLTQKTLDWRHFCDFGNVLIGK